MGAVKVIIIGLRAIQRFDAVDFVKVVETDVARTVRLIECSVYCLLDLGRVEFRWFFM